MNTKGYHPDVLAFVRLNEDLRDLRSRHQLYKEIFRLLRGTKTRSDIIIALTKKWEAETPLPDGERA